MSPFREDEFSDSSSSLGSPLEGLISCLSTSSSSDISFPLCSPILMLTPPDSSNSEEDEDVNQDELTSGGCTERGSSGAVDLGREAEVLGFSRKQESESAARVGSKEKVIPLEPDVSFGKLRQILKSKLNVIHNRGSPIKDELKLGEKNVVSENLEKGKSVDGLKSAVQLARIRTRSLEKSASRASKESQFETNNVSLKACEASLSSAPARILPRSTTSLEKSDSGTEEEPRLCEKNVVPEMLKKRKSVDESKAVTAMVEIIQAPETNFRSELGSKSATGTIEIIQAPDMNSRLLEVSRSRETEEEQPCVVPEVTVSASVETNNVSLKACEASFTTAAAQIRTKSFKPVEKLDSPKEKEPNFREEIVISVDGSKHATATVKIVQAPDTNFDSEPSRIRMSSLQESGSRATEKAPTRTLPKSITSLEKSGSRATEKAPTQNLPKSITSLEKSDSATEENVVPEILKKGKSVDGSKSVAATVEITQAPDTDFDSQPARIRMRLLEESGSRMTEEAQVRQINVVPVPEVTVAASNSMNACQASFSTAAARIQSKSLEKSDSPTEEEPKIPDKIVIPGILTGGKSIERSKSRLEIDSIADTPTDNNGGQGQATVSIKRKLSFCYETDEHTTNKTTKRRIVSESDNSRYDDSSPSGTSTDGNDEHSKMNKIPPKVALLLKVLKICAKEDDECRLPKPETAMSLVEIARMRGMNFP